MYRYLTLILFSLLFSINKDLNETTLLFHLNHTTNDLSIINSEDRIVTNPELNHFFSKNNVYKIEKWIDFASETDIYNGINFSRVYRIYFDSKTIDLNNLKLELELLESIDLVEFEYKRRPFYTPNDPRYNNQWYIDEIRSNDAWDIWDIATGDLPGNRDIILSSVDLGVNWQHPDLVNNLWQNLGEDADGDGRTVEYINGQWVLDPGDLNGIDDDNWDNNMSTFIDDLVGWDVSGSSYGDNNPDVPNNGGWAHGTHVAGLLSATTNNNTGIASTAFNCSVMSVKCTNESEDPSYISNGYEGLLYAAKAGFFSQGFSIVNLSWGGGGYNLFEQEMVSMCTNDYNALIFAAAGNENVEEAHYPSSYNDVISVTASGPNNGWNHWATYHETVDLASPGESIESCVNNGNGYSSWAGTSMASPVAASIAGLMKSMHPEWMVEQLHTMIVATANPIIYEVNPENYIQGKLGSGRVDALKAVTTDLFPKIDLVDTEIIMDNDEIYIGDTIELITVLYNNDNWGEAINPEINLSCLSDDINIINDTMPIENISTDEAMVNFEPIIIEFSGNINPGETECVLNFTSNQDSYIKYETSFPITFNISETQILLGDLNQDTSIDILDVIITVNIILEVISPNGYENTASDLNIDDIINIQDVILLINLILDR
tara:strand:+ start:3694 stop:5679 length:1986 start_codon:yes stop_codon:yes gene_type:complete